MAEGLVKRCRICGDIAKSFNYSGQASCPSCRVFFYRNAAKYANYECRKQDQCEIDFVSRKCCIKCRLRKCFAAGMRLGGKTKAKISVSSSITLEAILRDHDQKAIENEIKKINNKSNRNKSHFELGTYTASRIAQIVSRVGEHFVEESRLTLIGEMEGLLYVSQCITAYTRRAIRFCKSFDHFATLEPGEQLRAFKAFCFDSMIVRAAFQYDPIGNFFVLLENESARNAIKVAGRFLMTPSSIRLSPERKCLFTSLHFEMDNDVKIRDLLTTLSLMKPLIEGSPKIQKNLEDSSEDRSIEWMRYTYCAHSYLLRRYLEAKYRSSPLADAKFARLMALLDRASLDRIFENFRTILSEFGVEQVNQIIVEIFNLST